MKENLSRVWPFFCMLFLAMGSVIVSCTTTSAYQDKNIISLNTGIAEDGNIYTTWILDDIQSVIITDDYDRAKKIELSSDQWSYNNDTTEIKVFYDIPFSDFIVSVEGVHKSPNTFFLRGITVPEELLVILDGRLGIEGYDYTLDEQTDRLTFRNDIDLQMIPWYISYTTPEACTSIGEWTPESQDQIAYLEAEHRRRYLNLWYDKQEAFWFFEGDGTKAEPPALVKREASPKELAEFKSTPVSVIKMRHDSDFSELSKEMGFNVQLPEAVDTAEGSLSWKIFFKSIEEYSCDGKLKNELHVMYRLKGDIRENDRYIEIVVSSIASPDFQKEKTEPLIEKESLSIGVPVTRTRFWGMITTGTSDKPEAVMLTTWEWTYNEGLYYISTESTEEENCMDFIEQITGASE
ncbi:MAG: hypothetical protein PQJ46_01430 [Spirochaetales bacterium]|nr:hypothetical protein [Spirochaetales bacterium]